MFKLDLEKAEEPEIKLPTFDHHWIMKKARNFQKNIYFCFTDYTKAFDCGSQQTAENSSLYAGQEATVRTIHGTADWFQIKKIVCQGCILLPCLFNLHAGYLM